jgi:hypothetical protein
VCICILFQSYVTANTIPSVCIDDTTCSKCCNVDCAAASCTNLQDCTLGLPKRVVCIHDTTAITYLAHCLICYPTPQWLMLFRPDLLSVLAQQLQSADVLASHRVFMVLFRTLKELSTKRLAVDQKNYAEVTSFCIVETHLSVCIAAQMCLCFIQCFFLGGGSGFTILVATFIRHVKSVL